MKSILLLLSLFLTTSISADERVPAQIPGLYETSRLSQTVYEDESGHYYLTGMIMDLGGASSGLGENLDVARVSSNIAIKMGGKVPDSVKKTPIMGIYEVAFGKMIKYMDGSGRFMFRNTELFDHTGQNLTHYARVQAAKDQGQKNLAVLQNIPESEMLIYQAENEQYALTVFTDVDCPFCQKFHQDLPQYLDKGVSVRYLFYPRAGKGSPSYRAFVSVWCHEDSQETLSKIERGEKIKEKQCPHPVDKHMAVVSELGLLGTPVVMLDDGRMVYGYYTPSELLANINI